MNKTLRDEEKNLIEEVDFFNRNYEWWSNEFERVSRKLALIEAGKLIVPEAEMNNLVSTFTYLTAKVQTEKRASEFIEKKIYKFRLKRDLHMIQGDMND